MAADRNGHGLRMDLVLGPDPNGHNEIVELKRGSHLLLAHQGKLTQRLSRALKKAVAQLDGYGQRVPSDMDAVRLIESQHGIRIANPSLRLVAGRRLTSASGYLLLSKVELDASAEGMQLQVYTWDGFLAELERIVNSI